ncbi:diguanylate cyclase (GGDEF) domain protein [compost metagenome]
MTLRKRLLWLSIPLLLLTVLIVSGLSQYLLLSRFDHQDRQLLFNTAEDLGRHIDNSITRNLDLLRSYAWWDDSYEFAMGLNREKFTRRNLDPDSLINLGFDFMVYVDDDGRVLAEQWVPPILEELTVVGGTRPDSQQGLRRSILARSAELGLLARHASTDEASGQTLLVQGVPLMLVSSPISNSQGTATPAGTVLAGLFLDTQRLEELQNQVDGTLHLLPTEDGGQRRWKALPGEQSDFLQRVKISPRVVADAQRQQVELLFHDLRGEPSVRMQISQPRTLYAQGRQAIGFFLRLTVAVALLALLLVYLGLDHWVLRRVQRMHAEVSGIGHDTPLPRLSDHGHDELGQLAHELNHMLERLAQSEARDQVILDSISDGYFEIDAQGRITSANRALLKQLGYSAEQLIGRSFREVLSAEDVERAQLQLVQALHEQGASSFAAPLRRSDGSLVYLETRFSLARDAQGTVIGFRGILRDVSDQIAYQNQLLDMAYRDPLTGLGNRKAFDEQLRGALDAAQRDQAPLTLMFIDLDHFKEVNDRFGHDIGDALLVSIAERLRQSLRQPDRFYRIGGDEFIMLLPGTGHEAAEKLARRLLFALASPIELKGARIDFVTPSIGIALFPEHADTPEALIKAADSAMYRAKQGRNQACVYRP